jgi:two-component system, NarL family, nitrate/nitrite response regulator NarL
MNSRPVDKIKILLVDDHKILRSGLRMLISSYPGLQIVGEAENRAEALSLASSGEPDIILLDLDLNGENSLDFLPDLLDTAPQSRVILLTGLRDPGSHRKAVRLGAMGVVLKDEATEVLVKAIEKVHLGEVWLDASLVAGVLASISRPRGTEKVDPEIAKIESLTEREHEVIALVCLGLPNKQIAERLSITETTIRHHLTSIFNKLGLQSRLELVIYAYKHGLAAP